MPYTPTDPTQPPFARYASYLNDVGPAPDEVLLNGEQDYIAWLYGALMGRSAYLGKCDFEKTFYGSGMFGDLDVLTNTNGAATMATGAAQALIQGEHGVWQCLTNTTSAWDFEAADTPCFVGDIDFLFNAKVKLVALAQLESVAADGFHIGLGDVSSTWPFFVCGNDKADWRCVLNGVETGSGVAVTDGDWFDLQITRAGVNFYFWINGVQVVATSLALTLDPTVNRVSRYLRCAGPGASVGQGFYIDRIDLSAQR